MISTIADTPDDSQPRPPLAGDSLPPKLCQLIEDGTTRYWRREEVWSAIQTAVYYSGDRRMMVHGRELARYLDSDITRWFVNNPKYRPCDPDEPPERYAPMRQTTVSREVSEMEIRREQGRGSQSEVVNPFLADPIVDHGLGTVQGWKAAWTLRANTSPIDTYRVNDDHPPMQRAIVGAIVVGRPNARAWDNGDLLQVDRLACHPIRPKNSNSRLLATAVEWARDQGYDRVVTYAGGTDESNHGGCYQAVDFELDAVQAADSSGWKDQGEDRETIHDGDDWQRRRWMLDL